VLSTLLTRPVRSVMEIKFNIPSLFRNLGAAPSYAGINYRPDIDGLRAVAVLLVVVYHAGMETFGGGFIGVDIFFVISGYLITQIIAREIREGRFSIINFYERRVRRIFPALIAVVFVSSILASLIILPIRFMEYGQSVIACSLFVSNMLFWSEAADYFDAAAHTKPMLHTWSLAIEEQFYIVFPLVLMLAFRWLNGRWTLLMVIAAVSSFSLSVWSVEHNPAAAFYLAPTRAWELILGSLIALGAFPPVRNGAIREILSFSGLCLIGWGAIGLTAASPFPGFNALYPCLGAGFLIHSGASGQTLGGKLLSLRPIVFIGLISYSLYLWHWPLFVLANNASIYEMLDLESRLGIVLLSIVLAAFSWKFIEQPFRGKSSRFTRRSVFIQGATAMGLFICFGMFVHYSKGWPGRISDKAEQLTQFAQSKDPREFECFSRPSRPIDPKDACVYGSRATPSVAVWGDSHAGAVIHQIGKMAFDHGQSVKFFGFTLCPPVLAMQVKPKSRDKCADNNESVLSLLESTPSIKTVVLIARYTLYLSGYNTDFGPAERMVEMKYISFVGENGPITDPAEKARLLELHMRETVHRLVTAGKRVVLMYPIPETGYVIPETLAKIYVDGGDIEKFTRPYEYYKKRQAVITGILDRLGESEQIVRIRPSSLLCDSVDCIVSANGKSLYYDDDHLSLEGTEYISPIFKPLFESPGALAPIADKNGTRALSADQPTRL